MKLLTIFCLAMIIITTTPLLAIDFNKQDIINSNNSNTAPVDRIESITNNLIIAIDYKREIIIDKFIDKVGNLVNEGKMVSSDMNATIQICRNVLEKIQNEDNKNVFLSKQEKKFNKLIKRLEVAEEKLNAEPVSRTKTVNKGFFGDGDDDIFGGILGEVEHFWAKDCGKRLHKALTSKYRVIKDPQMNQRVRAVGRKMVDASRIANERIRYTFTILDMVNENNEPVLNAFTGPAGYIYVTPKLLDFIGNDDNILAGVLGHEIGHNTEGHVVTAMERNLAFKIILGAKNNEKGWTKIIKAVLVDLPISRENEFQADRKGIEFTYRAQYNPFGLVKFFEKLVREYQNYKPSQFEVIFQTHPPTGERISRAVAYIQNELYNNNNGYNPNNPYPNNPYPNNPYPNNPYPNNPYPNNPYPNNPYPNNPYSNNQYPNQSNNPYPNNPYPNNPNYNGYNNDDPSYNPNDPINDYQQGNHPAPNNNGNYNNGGVPAPPNTNGAPGTQFNPPYSPGPNPGHSRTSDIMLKLLK